MARELIEETRRDAAALEQDAAERKRQADEQQVEAEAAEQRARRRFRLALIALAVGVVFALGGAALGVVLSIVATNAVADRREGDIRALAAELAQPVAEKVLADGRAQSAQTYREGLDRANARLLRAGLPIVAQPPPDAPAAEVQRQSIRATVLADLGGADVLADALRRQFEGVNTFPALAGLDDPSVPAEPGASGDITVTVLPDESGPAQGSGGSDGDGGGRDTGPPSRGGSGGSGGSRGGPSSTGSPRPPSVPVPAPTRAPGGLLPDLPIVPRLPLLGG